MGKKENKRKLCPIIKLFLLNKDLVLETLIYQKIITEEKNEKIVGGKPKMVLLWVKRKIT